MAVNTDLHCLQHGDAIMITGNLQARTTQLLTSLIAFTATLISSNRGRSPIPGGSVVSALKEAYVQQDLAECATASLCALHALVDQFCPWTLDSPVALQAMSGQTSHQAE